MWRFLGPAAEPSGLKMVLANTISRAAVLGDESAAGDAAAPAQKIGNPPRRLGSAGELNSFGAGPVPTPLGFYHEIPKPRNFRLVMPNAF